MFLDFDSPLSYHLSSSLNGWTKVKKIKIKKAVKVVNEKRRLLMGRVWGREKLVLLVKGRNAGGKRVDLEIRKKT